MRYRPWAPSFSRTVCVLSALLAQLGQVELGLQSHLQGTGVDELQLHPQACEGQHTRGQLWTIQIKAELMQTRSLIWTHSAQ